MNTTSEASTRRRVKLYILNEERSWDDKGTGHVSAMMNDNTSMSLVVISESDGSVLLESRIQNDTAYQKQQETLIVWSEGETSDLALSFQEKTGCDDIWEKICNVQGKDPSVEITQELSDESDETDDDIDADNSLSACSSYGGILGTANNSSIGGSLLLLDLPNLELSNLPEIVDIFNTHATLRNQRELLAHSILEKGTFLKQLCDVFHKADDLDDIESLHHIHDIAKQMLLLNHPQLYLELFSPSMLTDLIGMLEYTPQGHKSHRAFLQEKAQFKDVLDLTSSSSSPEMNELTQKIHQTYRIQYIQDCCLSPPSMLDENSTHNLQSLLQQNKSHILRQVLNNDIMMRRLLAELGEEAGPLDDRRRRELTFFLRELCQMCASLNGPEKDSYTQKLLSITFIGPLKTKPGKGYTSCLLGVLKRLFLFPDEQIVYAALDILHILVDTHCTLVRDYLFREGHYVRDDEDLFFNILIDQMLCDKDPEGSHAMNISIIVRNLIDPESIMGNGFSQMSEKNEFVTFLLGRVLSHLFGALQRNTKMNILVKDDYRTAVVLNHVLEIFSYCIDAHSHSMKNFANKQLLFTHVATLLQSKHTFLVLGVIRFLRKLLNLKDEYYNRVFTKYNLLPALVEVFRRNGRRYNLLNSAMVEMFDFILSEPVLCLVQALGQEGFLDRLCMEVDYVDTFDSMKVRYESLTKRNSSSGGSSLVSPASSYMSAASALQHSNLPMTSSTVESLSSFSNVRTVSTSGITTSVNFHSSISSAGSSLGNFHSSVNSGNNSVISPLACNNSQRFRRDPRTLDEEEEQWFNQDDDEEDDDEEEELALGQTQSSLTLGSVHTSYNHRPLPSLQLPLLSSNSNPKSGLNCAAGIDSSSSDDDIPSDGEGDEKKAMQKNIGKTGGFKSALSHHGISGGNSTITIQLKTQLEINVNDGSPASDRKRKSISVGNESPENEAPNKKKLRGVDAYAEEGDDQESSLSLETQPGELGSMFSPPHGHEDTSGRTILEDIDDSTTSGSSSTAEMDSQLCSGLVDYSDEDSEEDDEHNSRFPVYGESRTEDQEKPQQPQPQTHNKENQEDNHSILANSISLTGPLQLPVVTNDVSLTFSTTVNSVVVPETALAPLSETKDSQTIEAPSAV